MAESGGKEVGIALLCNQGQRSRGRRRMEAIFAICLSHWVELYIYIIQISIHIINLVYWNVDHLVPEISK